jgi:TonB family protein
LGTLSSSTNRLWATDPDLGRAGSEARCEVTETTHLHTARGRGPTSLDLPAHSRGEKTVEEVRLGKLLEQAQLVTGATGAAIALIQGAEMICCATAGLNAPDLGTCLHPTSGLSGRCIQTRELQQCSDTETDPHVDLEACRRLGVRSIVVLPLMESGELFGIFEVLSSHPDAFGQSDLETLQALTDQVLENRSRRSNGDAAPPRRDSAVDPMQAELLAREIFTTSSQRRSRRRHGSYWTAIRLAATIGLAVLLGWIVGNAGWKMAVDRAESQASRPQEEIQPPVQVASSLLPVSSGVEQPTLAQSETPSSSENAATFQTAGARDGDLAVVTTQIAPRATNGYVLTEVKPEYPEQARQQHIQGQVMMKVLVGIDGLVRDIVATSGDPQLVKSAADAVRQWRFLPHTLEGQPVEFETQIIVNFALT